MIRRDSVGVFCTHSAWVNHLSAHVTSWRNVRLVMTEVSSDADECENLKVQSLLGFVRGCSKVGVALASQDVNSNDGSTTSKAVDPHIIESWPLISAFAVEGVGPGGFFTQRYKVADVTKQVNALYRCVDSHLLERFCVEEAPMLAHHFQNTVDMIDKAAAVTAESHADGVSNGADATSIDVPSCWRQQWVVKRPSKSY